MENKIFASIIFLTGVLIASFSQVLLKKSAEKNGGNGLKAYFNPLVIVSYSLFVISTLVSLLCLKFLPLSRAPILDSASYIFVAVLSRIFFKEKINLKKAIGFIFIVTGIFISVL